MATSVVNLYRDQYDAYIGRPGRDHPDSPFGNLWAIGKEMTREQVLLQFEEALLESDEPYFVTMRARLNALRDQRLGCFCKPKDCHGDIHAWHADSLEPGEILPKGGKRGRFCATMQAAKPAAPRTIDLF